MILNDIHKLSTEDALAHFGTKGYNMLADDNDRKILSRDPLIILKPKGSLEQTSVKQLTRREIVEATKNFKTALAPDQGGGG